jgi:hypothetical protein
VSVIAVSFQILAISAMNTGKYTSSGLTIVSFRARDIIIGVNGFVAAAAAGDGVEFFFRENLGIVILRHFMYSSSD